MLPTDLLGKASSVLLEKLEADFCIEFVHISNGSDFVMGWGFMAGYGSKFVGTVQPLALGSLDCVPFYFKYYDNLIVPNPFHFTFLSL